MFTSLQDDVLFANLEMMFTPRNSLILMEFLKDFEGVFVLFT